MLSRFKHHYFSIAAMLTAIVFSAIEVAGPLSGGRGHTDMNTPLGLLARFVASLFTPAPSLLRAGSDRAELTFQLFVGATLILLLLFILFLYLRVDPAARRSAARNHGLILAQLLIGVGIGSVPLNLIVAAQLAVFMPLRRGLAWLAVQVMTGFAIDLYLIYTVVWSDGTALAVLLNVILEYLVQVLAFGGAWFVGLERQTRLSLAAAHAELLATQSLLGDTVRASERMRIARDLHDMVGHHLTALNLHLDLALRQSEGKAASSLQTSRDLAQDMLAEVRSMVGAERDQPINLREALQTLCSGIPAPQIKLAIEDRFEIHSPAAAHALFCCVQEAITNAVRHAQADVLTIGIGTRANEIVVAISDNGRGNRGNAEGNGLRGMRERLAQLGGALTAGNLPTRGFGLELCMPRAGATP